MNKPIRGDIFQTVKFSVPNRNAFDLSNENRFSCNEGWLIPISCREVLPGDVWNCRTSIMVRLAPLVAPMMQKVDVKTEAFYVPFRQIWEDQDKYFNPVDYGNVELPVKPYFTYKDLQTWSEKNAVLNGTLMDYLGYPTFDSVADTTFYSEIKISALPLRAYQHIYNEYYRDENLQDEVPIETTSGHVSSTEFGYLHNLHRRCWTKDYFTSALTKPQRGADVKIPLGTSAPIKDTERFKQFSFETAQGQPVGGQTAWIGDASGSLAPGSLLFQTDANGKGTIQIDPGTDGSSSGYVRVNTSNLYADLSNASAITIEMLRVGTQLQKFLEAIGRGGHREVEQQMLHFGVRIPDLRVHRPQYLGGAKTPVAISEVVQTSASSNTTVAESTSPKYIGSLAGYGISYGNEHGYRTDMITERGFIVVLLSIMPTASYQQGLSRMLTKMDVLDEYFPEFAHLGEQLVTTSEIYFDPTDDDSNDSPFGYQSRYAEYKYFHDEVHGDFKGSLAFWHQGRIFDSAPALNNDFVKCVPDYRPFAVTDPNVHHFWVETYNNIVCQRPMPIYGTPLSL